MDIIPILVVIGCVYVVKGTIVIIISSDSFVVFVVGTKEQFINTVHQ